jgi:predicted RNA methylase
MCGAGQLAGQCVWYGAREVTAPLLDVREIEVAPHHERRCGNLIKAAESGRYIQVRSNRRRAKRDPVHIEE